MRIFLTGTSIFLPVRVDGMASNWQIWSGTCRGEYSLRSVARIFSVIGSARRPQQITLVQHRDLRFYEATAPPRRPRGLLIRSNPLDDQCDTLADADAHRAQRVAAFGGH